MTDELGRARRRPLPIIRARLCDGCGLCVRACPNAALALRRGKAVVVRPDACDYAGLCEAVCPQGAIQRPFEIVLPDADDSGVE